MSSQYVLGLDIGTSHLRVCRAAYGEQDSARPLLEFPSLKMGAGHILPALLSLNISGDEGDAYGSEAVERLRQGQDEARFVHAFKPSLNDDSGSEAFPSEETFRWTEQLVRHVMEDLRTRVYRAFRPNAESWRIVAGVPSDWNPVTRTDLREALTRATGHDTLEIVTETEAALAYHVEATGLVSQHLERRPLLVIDLGVRSTTFTLCHMENGRVRQRGFCREELGGDDFDAVFTAYLADRLTMPTPGSLALRYLAREWKEQFSNAINQGRPGFSRMTTLRTPTSSYKGFLSLSREAFEKGDLAGGLIGQFRSQIERAIGYLDLRTHEIAAITIIGGGAGWYFVEPALRERFPEALFAIGGTPEDTLVQGLTLIPTLHAHQAAVVKPSASVSLTAKPLQTEEVTPTEHSPTTPQSLDIRQEVFLTAAESLQGGTKALTIDDRQEEVRLPAGLPPGKKVKFGGRGRMGPDGRHGDLILVVRILPGSTRGAVSEPEIIPDTVVDLTLTAAEAQQGCTKRLQFGETRQEVTIPPGVRSGVKLRFVGKGRPGAAPNTAGNLVVRCRIGAAPDRA